MIYSEQMLLTKYSGYANPAMKVSLETKKGIYLRLKRGFYTDSKEEHPFRIGNFLRSPSYVSFLAALSYYDLIPEHVFSITSATTGTGKTKEWRNAFGTFTYRDVPTAVFPYGIVTAPNNGYQIATKEKALADTLYSLPPVYSMKQLKELLYEDMRMEEEDIRALNRSDLAFLLPLYRSRNTNLFSHYLEALHGQ